MERSLTATAPYHCCRDRAELLFELRLILHEVKPRRPKVTSRTQPGIIGWPPQFSPALQFTRPSSSTLKQKQRKPRETQLDRARPTKRQRAAIPQTKLRTRTCWPRIPTSRNLKRPNESMSKQCRPATRLLG